MSNNNNKVCLRRKLYEHWEANWTDKLLISRQLIARRRRMLAAGSFAFIPTVYECCASSHWNSISNWPSWQGLFSCLGTTTDLLAADESRGFNKGGRLDHSAPSCCCFPWLGWGSQARHFRCLCVYILFTFLYLGQLWRWAVAWMSD